MYTLAKEDVEPRSAAQADPFEGLATIEHAGQLEDLDIIPPSLVPGHVPRLHGLSTMSCSYCGVGDGGILRREGVTDGDLPPPGEGTFSVIFGGRVHELPATLQAEGRMELVSPVELVTVGGLISGTLIVGGQRLPYTGRRLAQAVNGASVSHVAQIFERYSTTAKVKVTRLTITDQQPTTGCVKLHMSTMRQPAAYPICIQPSELDRDTGKRRNLSYTQGIARFADLVLTHRQRGRRILVYGSGQVDYFTVFALQEVFRLLGVRNLTGNAEHCLNAGAVHNEILTGQEGPFITIDQAISGPNRVYLFNGWNGSVSHPPVYRAISQRPDFDAHIVEVMASETVLDVAKRLGPERALLIRSGADGHLALAVAHEIFQRYPHAISERFLDRFSDRKTFDAFREQATSEAYSPERVAERIAPEPEYVARIVKGVRMLAMKLADAKSVPIVIPSVGLSQSTGVVAHALWGNVLGMLGKYGLRSDGTPAGGVLRIPGQINAESEVQGLSGKFFMGRIPIANAPEAARRMDLPENAYQRVGEDRLRPATDYSDPTPGEQELFICVGTQFEANMPNRRRWIDKLQDPANTLIVIDPVIDPWSAKNADLILPSPPHPATTKLYQNGEWRLRLSVPNKKAAPETRSDATILYDMMAEIHRRVCEDPQVAANHPDLVEHMASGYLQARFSPPVGDGPGLTRVDNEVSRVELWERVQRYLHGGNGPLYCSLDHADGRAITWDEILEQGTIIYGGVGTNRFLLDYDNPEAVPYRNIYRQPGAFRFFLPTPGDMMLPEGILLNTGRSAMSRDRKRVLFATSTFNSGKATPSIDMPDENPLFVSPGLARRLGLNDGDWAAVNGTSSGCTVKLPVVVSDRVKGDTVYTSFHLARSRDSRGLYINDVTDHVGRCAYSNQVKFKVPRITISRVDATSTLGRKVGLGRLERPQLVPMWSGEDTPLRITEILRDTDDTTTFRVQGDPLCRFHFKPGQFVNLTLEIGGKRIIRSYSISSSPTRPYTLELTVKRVPGGLVSNWMPDNLKVGDSINLKGPKGSFCLEPTSIPPKILLVGAGSGITPVMSIARWLCDVAAPVDLRLYYSVKSECDFIFGAELEMMLARHPQFTGHMISATREVGPAWKGARGRLDAQAIQTVAPDLHERVIYMCGPEPFMEATKNLLSSLNFDLSQLHLESFGTARATRSYSIPPVEIKPRSVLFAKSGRSVKGDGRLTLLDIAEEAGLEIDYGCRSGSCGECKVKVLSGDVYSENDEGLDEAERAAGYVLSCVTRPRSDCKIDA